MRSNATATLVATVLLAPTLLVTTLLVTLGACAPQVPYATDVPTDAASISVTIFGDGFVRVDGRRIAFDRLLLELRQRARATDEAALGDFVVYLQYADGIDPDAFAAAEQECDRLLMELDILDLGRVVYN